MLIIRMILNEVCSLPQVTKEKARQYEKYKCKLQNTRNYSQPVNNALAIR